MITRRRPLVGAGMVLSVLLAAGALLVLLDDSTSARLAGAGELAAGGDVTLSQVMRGDADWTSLDDVPIGSAAELATGQSRSFYVLLEDQVSALVEASPTGRVERAGLARTRSPDGVTAIGIARNGRMAVALGSDVLLRAFNWTGEGDDTVQSRFDVGAVAWADDGTLLLGSVDHAVIDAVDQDGTVRRLLGPPGDSEAEVQTDQPLGRIVSLVALPDERVAFVAETAGGYRLCVLDGDGVRVIEDGLGDLDGTEPADETVRADRYPMQPLAPGPDGRVLATGSGPGGDPQISLVDVESGEVEVLAELEGVEPSVQEPVSAAAVGNDLIFLADGRIWKLESVFG